MIWEAFLYATARSTLPLRRLGLVGDAVALRSRALRQRRAWAPHEERCKRFVASAAEACERRRTVVVLGSGLVRDVPLEKLCELFDRVVLVDAVHLLPTRQFARRHGVELVCANLSGVDGVSSGISIDGEIDLVVSANLLSQMPLAHRRRADDWESREPLAAIGRHHLATLDAFGAMVCLLTDVAYCDVRSDGGVSDETPLVDESLLPAPDESWDWQVAPRGEIDRDFARVHRVCAWRWTPVATAAGQDARGLA